MSAFRIFVIIWIVLELIVFVAVAKLLGLLVAILLIILSMFVGGGVMRVQGMDSMRRAQEEMAAGRDPKSNMLDAMAKVFGGMLMVIPGFITSIIGICLIIPGLRSGLARLFMGWGLFQKMPKGRPAQQHFGDAEASNDAPSGRTIEGEVDDEKK